MVTQQITPEWYGWIAENLVLNVSRDKILSTLTTNGFTSEEAKAAVDLVLQSDSFRHLSELTFFLKKWQWVFEVYKKLGAMSKYAHAVERRSFLSREEFLERYYVANRPVIITGVMKNWKALTLWTPEYLKQKCGDNLVEVQMSREKDPNYEVNMSQHKQTMRFADYVDMVHGAGWTNDFYMTAYNSTINRESLQALYTDIEPFPEYLNPHAKDNPGFIWYGPAGTVTPLHHDMTNNFMAQVQGTKLIKLVAPYEMHLVYNHYHCYSELDLDKPVDLAQYPLFERVNVIECVLYPGEVLFLPIGWLHYVKALDISITVAFTNFLFDNYFSEHYQTYHRI